MGLAVDKSIAFNYGNQTDTVKQKPGNDNEVVKIVYVKVPADELKTDIKRGGIPTLKGVGAGAAAGVVAGVGTLVGMGIAFDFMSYAPPAAHAIVGGGIGAVVGGVSANFTDSKTIAGLSGAVVGAAAGYFLGMGIVTTAAAGAAGGIAGAIVSQRK